jgi:hypothetical protein
MRGETSDYEPLANELSLDLLNYYGVFNDSFYATFDPTLDNFNGTINEKYLRKRFRVWLENIYMNDFEPIFTGRVQSGGFATDLSTTTQNSLQVSCIDLIEDCANYNLKDSKGFVSYNIAQGNESESIIHSMARLALQDSITNFLTNSKFNNTTITNSWKINST